MHVYYLDVGQAEATLLLGNGFTILIDAGDRGENDVIEHLQGLSVDSIDLFGRPIPMRTILGRRPRFWRSLPWMGWMSGYEHSTRLFEEVLDAILETGACTRSHAGEHPTFGELQLVLNPLVGPIFMLPISWCGSLQLPFFSLEMRKRGQGDDQEGLPLAANILRLGHPAPAPHRLWIFF